ncbi:hypothetical protein [Protaetiibacter intestinalis]|uniref:Uncharacterized protein n=1 Tax=Protaetiibacter intestinalis TaxID=2419774 RepID=A0A387BB05_9MICO|nr:hypothetical protein [Protaetiibacter intestinalis]AYF98888.1 hypothetical protein D7I47_11905 [Protaetiibacter intestinalis]
MTAHRSDREEAEDALRARASLAGDSFDHEALEAPGSAVGYPAEDVLDSAGELADELADDEGDASA